MDRQRTENSGLLVTFLLSWMLSQAHCDSHDCLLLEPFAQDLWNPTSLASPDDDSERIFITTQHGVMYLYHGNGTRQQQPFLDLTDRVSIVGGLERGLVGTAFHPDYRSNGKVYVYYTTGDTGEGDLARLSEFRASGSNPNVGDPDSERIILELNKTTKQHVGGQVLFGTDDYLYLFVGDDGESGDPDNNAQNRNILFGSVLRLDVTSEIPANSSQAYNIPPDNPFVNDSESRPEIFAYGFRNPFRGDVDEGDSVSEYGKGRIFVGDVGSYFWEEIDVVKKGLNYGWNFREGPDCRNDTDPRCGTVNDELPIHAYNRSSGDGFAVIGGHVYRGSSSPSLNGKYFFGDYVFSKVWTLTETAADSNQWERELVKFCDTGAQFPRGSKLLSFGEDNNGEVYVLTTNDTAVNSNTFGLVHRIVQPMHTPESTTTDVISDAQSYMPSLMNVMAALLTSRCLKGY